MKIYTTYLLLLACLLLQSNHVFSQLTSSEAGYVNAVSDFGADPTGLSVTTTQLQAAIDGAIAQGKGLFIPAGTYLIDNELVVTCDTPGAHDKPVIIAGSSVNVANRSVILLKSGSFTNRLMPKTIIKQNGWNNDYTNTYDRVIQSIDIKIEANNAGAIGLDWRGAEGCGIFDVNIDVTGGFRGMLQAPGSGGSTVDTKIKGGEIGIDLSTRTLTSGGTQPTPVFTNVQFEGQTECAIKTNSNRGTVTFVGCNIQLNPGVIGIKNSKTTSNTYRFGGNVLFVDSKIEYISYSSSNILFQSTGSSEVSFYLNNVYIRNCNNIVSADAVIPSNTTGWRHFKDLAYSCGDFSSSWGVTFKEKIHVDGIEQSSNFYQDFEDVSSTPGNLTTVHSWGETFPSFESAGAINVQNYAALVNNGDWSPAFNQAIQDAESTASHVVFVPAGKYDIYNTIHLGMNTKLIGVSPMATELFGYDLANRRFAGSTDAFADPRPMIKSPINGLNTLADIAVYPAGPYNNEAHSPVPCVHYSLLWQSNGSSIIRNTSHDSKVTNNYRPSLVVLNNLTKDNWLSLKSIASPSTINGFVFSSNCESQYFNQTKLPSRIFVETVSGNKRLMARSISPFNAAANSSTKSNIIIENNGSLFTINSLKLANASWNPLGGDTVLIEGYSGTTKVIEKTVLMAGINKPRVSLETVILGWSNLTKVTINSSAMFSIDDVTINNVTTNFESVVADAIVSGVDYNNALYYDTMRDLPLSNINHHLVKITGGVRWFNFWKHGDTWMRPTQAYICVENNTHPVNFYHFHAQHSMNDQKLLLNNAKDVSVFGIKTENAGYFIQSLNSNNIRVFGHGGLTTAPKGSMHYKFKNTTNYLVSSLTDEVYNSDYCQYCGAGNALLIQSQIGTYDALVDLTNGISTSPNRFDRPILWKKGAPVAAYYSTSSNTYSLVVNDGAGSGQYNASAHVEVTAQTKQCMIFKKWIGDNEYLADSTLQTTTFTMPNKAASITASYTNLAVNKVTVNGGVGSGDYCDGAEVEITAIIPQGKTFLRWTGNIELLSNTTQVTQTFIMPADKAPILTAEFANSTTGELVTGHIYVDASRPDDSGDGLSWATAKKTIAGGIAVCDLMYTGAGGYLLNTAPNMLVAQGTYNEKVWPNKPNAAYVYPASSAVKFYGGFPTGGSSYASRNPKNFETILDGTGIVLAQEAGTPMSFVDLIYATLMDGFIIQNVTNTMAGRGALYLKSNNGV